MASNSTGSSQLGLYVLYGTYLGQGVVIGLSNLLISVALLRFEALRSCNRFKFIIAQSMADFINMMGYAYCGFYRMLLLWKGTYGQLVPVLHCALQPHRLLWGIWGDRLVTLMQLLIACDRFLSVLLPLEYIGWGAVYSRGAISASYGFIMTVGLLGLYLQWGVGATLVSNQCTSATVRAAGDAYGWYYGSTAQIYTVLTFPIYAAVVVLYRRKAKVMADQLETIQAEQVAQQRRFTKSLVINCLTNLFLWAIPYTVGQLSRRYGWGGTAFGSLSFAVSNFYPLCDVVIFSARHREVRQAISGLFLWKHMPADLRQWGVNEAAKAQNALSQKVATNVQQQNQNDLQLQDV